MREQTDRRLELARHLRSLGLEQIKLAADLEAQVKRETQPALPLYIPTFPIIGGVETYTERFACCGAGTDQRDERTGERLHFRGCRKVAADSIAACRRVLNGDPA